MVCDDGPRARAKREYQSMREAFDAGEFSLSERNDEMKEDDIVTVDEGGAHAQRESYSGKEHLVDRLPSDRGSVVLAIQTMDFRWHKGKLQQRWSLDTGKNDWRDVEGQDINSAYAHREVIGGIEVTHAGRQIPPLTTTDLETQRRHALADACDERAKALAIEGQLHGAEAEMGAAIALQEFAKILRGAA